MLVSRMLDKHAEQTFLQMARLQRKPCSSLKHMEDIRAADFEQSLYLMQVPAAGK
jgi:hypothetical protein